MNQEEKRKKKKKHSKKASTESDAEPSPLSPSSSKPGVLHSKTTTKTMQSTTKSKIVNGKTETVQRKTVSHNTQIKSGDSNVSMTFSQQSETQSQMDHEDPLNDKSTTTTQTYKRMDVRSPEGTDSHTEINSSQESVSAVDESEVQQSNSNSNGNGNQYSKYAEGLSSGQDFDIYTVGNPTAEEIAWRKSMLSPHAMIIHPDRLLPVLHGDRQRAEEYGTGWRYWRRRIKQTFTSVRERIAGNETLNDYKQRMTERTETIKNQLDTTQNYHIVQLRGMIDRLNMQTESSKAMQIIQDDFGDFWVEDFLPDFDKNLCPLIVRAFFNDDLEFLNTVCVGEAQVYCKNIIEGRMKENKMLAPDILWIHEAELVETKLHNKKPQLVIRADVQSVDCVYERGTDTVVEGSPSKVATNIFIMVLEPNVDEEYLNVVPLPWQVRSINTARQKQIV